MSKKINVLIVFFLSVGSLFSQTLCSDFKLTDFKINGNTTFTNNEATLTLALNNQSGSIWSNKKIDLSEDFRISADLNFGILDDSGADGIAFVIQPLSSDIGTLGGGIGYQGITPSLAIEFDTYFNVGWDPVSSDHIAIIKNGKTNDLTSHSEFMPFKSLNNIEDGLWHEVIFEWKASTKKLKVTFDNNIQIDTTIDIIESIFSGNKDVFWGFTAATGGSINVQKVRLKNYCLTLESCANIPEIMATKKNICSGELVNLSISNLPLLNNTVIPLQSEFEYIIGPLSSTKNSLTGTWQKGKSPFGSQISSPIPGLEANTIWPINSKLYLRKSVNLSNFDINTLEWKIAIDNGYKLFVNGNLVSQDFQEGYSYFWEYQGAVPRGFLNDGENTIEYELTDTGGLSAFETQLTANPFYSILWSTGATSTTINVSPDTTTTYWVEITANGIKCRKNITINVTNTNSPTGSSSQSLCNEKTIADIIINGSNILWYATATSTTPLKSDTNLINGTSYFASQTIGGCESKTRFEILISIVNVPNLSGESIQKFCMENEPTLKNLVVSNNNIKWFNSITNGILLSESSKLENNTTYYATLIDPTSGCESPKRLAVTPVLIKCEIIIYNSIKREATDMSDRLYIDDISYFPNNSIQIFNRYGRLVWETKGYNNATNAFKGNSNVSFFFQKDENLPDGTYFYILNYFNFIDQIQREKKGYLQLFNDY